MKKADSFSGIPSVPSSITGQWLAFNHMANHYRKLLNVKPRVDSSAPRRPSTNPLGKVASLSSYLNQGPFAPPRKLSQGTRKGIPKKSSMTKSKVVTCMQDYPTSTGDTDSFTFDSVSRPRTPATNKKRMTSKSIKTTSYLPNTPSDYQVVFGPSSLKSSSHALGSDCDSQPDDIPKVDLMGVVEKIQVFLKQLHANGTPLLLPSKKVTKAHISEDKKKYASKPVDVKESKSAHGASVMGAPTRTPRQSKCFLPRPVESSIPNTPKKAPIAKKKSCVSNNTAAMKQNNKPANQKKSLANVINTTKSKMENTTVSRSNKNKPVTQGESRGTPSIQIKSNQKKGNVRGGSIGSVGTIRGSDELTTDDMLTVPESNQLEDEVMNEYFKRSSRPANKTNKPKIVKSHPPKCQSQRSSIGIKNGNATKPRGSSAGYCSQSLSGKATSLSSLGIINHNDSSRDSAYGFSSGESRIPSTRESTPEKIRLSKPSSSNKSRTKSGNKLSTPLSTIASSVNLDCISHRPATDNHKSFKTRQKKQERRVDKKANPNKEDKYLNFISDVTDDIVNRGVYTNKGLKILFRTHLNRHPDLDRDKMNSMLAKLRSDLGIPGDDVMNRMEFGYGSVISASKYPPYCPGLITGESDSEVEKETPYLKILKSNSAEDIEALETYHKAKRIVDHVLHNHFGIPKTEICNTNSKKVPSIVSEDSLSETDIRINLKEVGIDSEATSEIVQTMQKAKRRHHHHHHNQKSNITSEDSSDDPPTRLINKSNNSKNSPISEDETVLRHNMDSNNCRSTSPSSSTESTS